MQQKSTIQEIKERFDKDVERFANLETGQVSTIDASFNLELITESAKRIIPTAKNLLDIGCGAGNYSLKMLDKLPDLQCTLVDLSEPMLAKAYERVSEISSQTVETVQGDIRDVDLPENHFDIILAGAVLHHLRDEQDWQTTFAKIYALLKTGGCLMIADLVAQDTPEIQDYIWQKYGEYLEQLNGKEYRQTVLAYIDKEDSPRSLTFQLDLMRKVGFKRVEILHKNLCFAAFGAIK